MRHVALTATAVAAVLVAIVACEDQSRDVTPTAPDVSVSFAKPTGGACDGALGRAITTQMADMFAKPQLDSAKALWTAVTDDCLGNPSVAREAMLAYVQFTINDFKANKILAPDTGTVAGALLAHWNSTFVYVGYAAPNLTTAIFDSTGAVGVITQSTVNRELAAIHAAITVPVQDPDSGDVRGHLFTINKTSSIDCLGDINLDQYGPCYDFHSFPTVDPRFYPMVKVGVCQPIDHDDVLPLERAALGHRPSSTSAFVEVPPLQSYPLFCTHEDGIVDAGSWTGGIKGITKRFAWLAKKAFGVNTAYAVHGGLGGLGGGLSPFGAVDRTVLFDAQHDETIPNFPADPEIGTWIDSVKSPGSITTAASLGDYQDTIIVLSQAGGNCTGKCGGLKLVGVMADSTAAQTGATYGKYEVGWVSVQTSSNIKSAPFVISDGNGKKIATLAYSTEQSVNKLRYNGDVIGAWAQNVHQTFLIRVNLDSATTSLYVNDSLRASNVGFQQTATAMRRFGAEFGGIDSGIMGWAKIFVRRLTDF
jgi:hypothetical protein